MDAVARVLAVGDGRARLACQVQPSCRSCGTSRGCGLRLLSIGRDPVLVVPDRPDASTALLPGEYVTITVPDGDVLQAAALAYLPLLVGLLAGALAGNGLAGHGDGPVALGSMVGLACGWAVARGAARRAGPRVKVRPHAAVRQP